MRNRRERPAQGGFEVVQKWPRRPGINGRSGRRTMRAAVLGDKFTGYSQENGLHSAWVFPEIPNCSSVKASRAPIRLPSARNIRWVNEIRHLPRSCRPGVTMLYTHVS